MIAAGDERGVKRLLHDAKSGENGTEPLRFGNSNRLCTLLPPSLSYESRMEAAFFDSQTVCRLRGPTRPSAEKRA